MVTVPIASSDNGPNARRLGKLGAAAVIDETDRSAARVEEALTAVLADGSYRRAAESLAAEIANTPAPSEVIANLER
jgi:UDP:flavonoid glycosyltransferase YjiC (YdhE family)